MLKEGYPTGAKCSTLLLLIMSACTFLIKKEIQEQSEYIQKNISTMNVSCDSFRLWFNESEKVLVNKTIVLRQIGINDSLLLKPATNSSKIYLHDGKKTYTVKRTDVSNTNKKTTWVVYFTDELKEILLVEIKSENPNSIIYFKPPVLCTGTPKL